MIELEHSCMLKYSDLTEPQRRTVMNLAQAEINVPPGWVVTVPKMNHFTVKKLTGLDLITVSHDPDALRARITRRGMDFYRRVLVNGRSTPHYSDNEIEAIIRARLAGETERAIAERVGCTPSFVGMVMRGKNKRYQVILDRMGVEPRRYVENYPKHIREKALKMRQAGKSYDEICEALGVTMGVLGYWIQQADLVTEGWINDDTRRRIIRLYREGMTQQQIADALGRSVRPVRAALNAFYRGEIDVEVR